jgi:hypothetical protein
MKIINKKNFKVIDKITNVPLKNYASLTDTQLLLIEENQKTGNLIDDGFGGMIEERYPFNVVKDIIPLPVEGKLLDDVDFIYFYEGEEKMSLLADYAQIQINNEFRGYKYKFHIPDFKALIINGMSDFVVDMSNNELAEVEILLPVKKLDNKNYRMRNVYVTDIDENDLADLQIAIDNDLILKETNEVYDLFNS